MSKDGLILVIDLGTSSSKTSLVDFRGRMVATSEWGVSTSYPRSGWAEQRPQDWTDSIAESLRRLRQQRDPGLSDVSVVGVCAHGPGLVLVDEEGEVLEPCPTWQDMRSVGCGDRLIREVGPDKLIPSMPRTGFEAKLLWAVENRRESVEKARWAMGVKDYIGFWLTGRVATDVSLTPIAHRWNEEVLAFIGVPASKLPPILLPTDVLGGVRRELAESLGLRPGVPVVVGSNDGACAALGSGATEPGRMSISLGTNGVVRVPVERPIDPAAAARESLFCYAIGQELWVAGGMTKSAAAALQWISDVLGMTHEEILAEAESSPPGSQGIVFLPYLAGMPGHEGEQKVVSAMLGLSVRQGRADIVRSVLEGVAYALKRVSAYVIQYAGRPITEIRITGGGSRSRLWMQIISDVMEKRTLRIDGGSTIGVAMIAATAMGRYPDLRTASRVMAAAASGTSEPVPEHATIYRNAYEQFCRYFSGIQNL